MRTCDFCERKHYSRGMCDKHYRRVRSTGDPHTLRTGHRFEPKDVFLRLYDQAEWQGECLLYLKGTTQRSGHTQVHFEGKMAGAHRVAWMLANGPVPEGMCVCHSCDVPRCVNPAHLWLGTVADNNADRDRKGRGRLPDPHLGAEVMKSRPVIHGRLSSYTNRGCRCEACSEANREYHRGRRASMGR